MATIDPAALMEQLAAAATTPNAAADREALDVTAQRLLEDLIQDAMTEASEEEEGNVENVRGLHNTRPAAAGAAAATATVKQEADMDEDDEEDEDEAEEEAEEEKEEEEVDEDDEEVVVDLGRCVGSAARWRRC